MTKQFYKLVPVAETEVSRDEPHVIVAVADSPTQSVNFINNGRPDWVLNVMEGSVGVFNMKKLTD